VASKREQILEALKVLVQAALPHSDVERNRDKPQSIGPGGTVIIRDGEPGEAEVMLSPLTYLWDHRIPVEVAVYESGGKTPAEVLDDMLRPIGAAIAADRTLAGLCDWVDLTAPITAGIESFGVEPGRWADFDFVATYATSNPLA